MFSNNINTAKLIREGKYFAARRVSLGELGQVFNQVNFITRFALAEVEDTFLHDHL
jgi:hypothetical protein